MKGLTYVKHIFSGAVKRVIIFFYKDAFPVKNIQKEDDLEKLALYPYCEGVGVDIGCGSKKTHPDALGVDTTPKGESGKYGSERRQISVADICASGDNLYIFADNSLDYVVSRHNLEHYEDFMKTLKEWKRVLKKGGILGVVLPDDSELDTIKIDPTHKHAFTKDIFKNILRKIKGFKIQKLETCVPKWSFVCIAEKVE
jgi:predicted SAM-dependent methyltransferase